MTLVLLLALALNTGPALARDQWSINHGGNNPPVDPRFMPGGTYSGYVPAVKGDFWKGQIANRVPAGTVLTAILEDNLSSGKNKQGDTFALTLDDGFANGEKMLIPPKSKIIGSIMNATSAKAQRNGRPGNMEISLQALVFPDGSHYPIFGFVDGNPNHKHDKPAKARNLGVSIADYGESLAGMAVSFVTGPGYLMKKMNRGLEFEMDKGDAIPIRLTRSLEITPPKTQAPLIAQPILRSGGDSSGIPYPPSVIPGLVDPSGPIQIPGFVPAAGQPYMGAPQTVRTRPGTMPPIAPSFGMNSGSGDPNAIFNQPIKPNQLNDLPDPF